MTPLARVAWGFLVVVVDVRTDGFDLVPDPLGWVLVLAGLVPLAGRDPWFAAASAASAVGLLVSLPQALAEPGALLTAVQSVVETGLVFGTCTGIMHRVEPPARTTGGRIRWTDLGLTAVTTAIGLAAGGAGQVTGAVVVLLLLPALAALAVMAWFALFLLGVQRHPALVQPRLPA